MNAGLVTIFGGSGFVGRYVAQELAKKGYRIRVACRHPNDAKFVEPYGVAGQVVPVFCNVRDDESVRAVTRGAVAVVNCVGILDETKRQTFASVQLDGARRIARIAAEQGVARMVHVSAIGADADSESRYAKTKAGGEAAVLEAMPDAVILRPSIVFGPEDAFFNRFAGLAQLGPVLPVVGADTSFQPVYVVDVARAAAMGVTGAAKPGIYELGGPQVETFRTLMERMLGVIERRRLVVNLPTWFAKLMAMGMAVGHTLTLGIVPRALTRDQIENLQTDNVVSGETMTFDDLGIEPTGMDAILPDYLWRFRASGQYAAIKNSARNLRT